MRFEGRPRTLAPALDQAAYRIVQESLTNAARHGGGGAGVDIAYGDKQLEISVSNPTSRSNGAATTGGHGILGMRERATLLGGSLEAGVSDGLFRVQARLPYTGAEERA